MCGSPVYVPGAEAATPTCVASSTSGRVWPHAARGPDLGPPRPLGPARQAGGQPLGHGAPRACHGLGQGCKPCVKSLGKSTFTGLQVLSFFQKKKKKKTRTESLWSVFWSVAVSGCGDPVRQLSCCGLSHIHVARGCSTRFDETSLPQKCVRPCARWHGKAPRPCARARVRALVCTHLRPRSRAAGRCLATCLLCVTYVVFFRTACCR